MSIPNRQTYSQLALSVNTAQVLELDDPAAGFSNSDTCFNIVVKPAVVQAGELFVEYSSSALPTTYATAYDDFGNPLTVAFTAATTTLVITDVDVCRVRFTNSTVAADQLYDVHITSVGG